MTRRQYAGSRVRAIITLMTQNRHAELVLGIGAALAILSLLGTNAEGQASLVDRLRSTFTEEDSTVSNARAADISSMFADGTGRDMHDSPSPSTDASTVGDNSLLALAPPDSEYIKGFKAEQVIKYTVQSGESIGLIASNFGVSIDTIVWANDISNPNVLSLGQVLRIPPVTGVLHTVTGQDTIQSIAAKYKADSQKISEFNDLREGQSLVVGAELIVPGGEKPGPKPFIAAAARRTGGSGVYLPVGDGQCVAFVQAHGYSKLHGNAYQWVKYVNTPNPAVGGVVVLRGGRFGHIAIITAVKPGSIQVVEQNYYGLYVIDHREISLNDKTVVGFIE